MSKLVGHPSMSASVRAGVCSAAELSPDPRSMILPARLLPLIDSGRVGIHGEARGSYEARSMLSLAKLEP